MKCFFISMFVLACATGYCHADAECAMLYENSSEPTKDSIKRHPGWFKTMYYTSSKKLAVKAEIMNENGQFIWARFFINGEITINHFNFEKGKYTVFITDVNGPIISERFIVK